VIIVEGKLLVRWKNITKYHQVNSNNEILDDLDKENHHKTKKKDIKI
jgi:hypothetical protein